MMPPNIKRKIGIFILSRLIKLASMPMASMFFRSVASKLLSFALGNIYEKYVKAVFSVMGFIAQADGKIDEDEFDAARQFTKKMHLNHKQSQTARIAYDRGQRADFMLQEVMPEWNIILPFQIRQSFLYIQTYAAIGRLSLDPSKRCALYSVGAQLGLDSDACEKTINAACRQAKQVEVDKD